MLFSSVSLSYSVVLDRPRPMEGSYASVLVLSGAGWYLSYLEENNYIVLLQAPQKHQKYVSHVLGLPMSKVVCKTKRIGGGFGGKETRSAFIAAAASVPSYLLNQPVKITLDRDLDMMITGQRHSFLGKYKVWTKWCFSLYINILLKLNPENFYLFFIFEI